MFFSMRRTPPNSKDWRSLAIWPAASGALKVCGNSEQMMPLAIEILESDSDSMHDLYWSNKSTADLKRSLGEYLAAFLAFDFIGLWIVSSLRVVA
jgi:hypothetical protein